MSMAADRTLVEKIEFVVEYDNKLDAYVVKTEKNPYLLIGRPKKYDAILTAFTKYLERLNEIEHPELKTATPLKISDASAIDGVSRHCDSNGEKETTGSGDSGT